MLRKTPICSIQIALSLLMLCGLATSCGVSSYTPAPPPSPYPADIAASVIITDSIIVREGTKGEPQEIKLVDESLVMWVTNVQVKNKSYESEITSDDSHWKIVDDQAEYFAEPHGGVWSDEPPMAVSQGEVGEVLLRFVVPQTLRLSDAELCYVGQEPYSFCNLSGGEKVALYDWDLKMPVSEQEKPEETQDRETYVVNGKQLLLKTIASWDGSESEVIEFEINQSPWVVHCDYVRVSSITAKFEVFIVPKVYVQTEGEHYYCEDIFGLLLVGEAWAETATGGLEDIAIPRSGEFVIIVDASGVNWSLKVGVE